MNYNFIRNLTCVPCIYMYNDLLHLQVNLEYLARVVFNVDGLLYPDSLVGTHTRP